MDEQNFQAFLAQQKARGAFDSDGQFTLHQSKAKLKLARFRMQDPTAYLLKLVQVGVLLRATRIVFCFSIKRVWVHYYAPQQALSVDDVLLVLGEPLGTRRGGLLETLSAGLNSAPAREIVFDQGYTGRRVRVGREVKLSEAPEDTDSRYQFSFLREELATLASSEAEERTLREGAQLCPAEIRMDGLVLNRSRTHPLWREMMFETWGEERFLLGESRRFDSRLHGFGCPQLRSAVLVTPDKRLTHVGSAPPEAFLSCRETVGEEEFERATSLVLLSLGWRAPARVLLVKHGVILESRSWPEVGNGVIGVLCVDDMATDLSGLQLAEDSRLDQRLEDLRVQFEGLLVSIRQELSMVELLVPRQRLALVGSVMGGILGGVAGVCGLATLGPLGVVAGGIGGCVAGLAGRKLPVEGLTWCWETSTGGANHLRLRIIRRLDELESGPPVSLLEKARRSRLPSLGEGGGEVDTPRTDNDDARGSEVGHGGHD